MSERYSGGSAVQASRVIVRHTPTSTGTAIHAAITATAAAADVGMSGPCVRNLWTAAGAKCSSAVFGSSSRPTPNAPIEARIGATARRKASRIPTVCVREPIAEATPTART
ncbi:MAG: hypothetical protein E6G08_06465 [Actinobacteria bacterium]|nr:MAG: hypothetical protein E6G08_06465 [Actinomycetota bacterium]